MKPIDKMNNVEKAYLLHQLFPEEIPAFVDYVKRVCETIKEGETEERAKGKYSVSTFEFWHDLVKDAERRIDRYGERLHKKARLFADQLFDGQNALFARYCLELYVETRKHENQTFTGIVQVLFSTETVVATEKTKVFKEQLTHFERQIVDAVAAELQRIARPVSMDELPYIPFSETVQDYVESMRLDESGLPILDCSFRDVSEKYLSVFISDNEIDHWDMISLVELLGNIQPMQP